MNLTKHGLAPSHSHGSMGFSAREDDGVPLRAKSDLRPTGTDRVGVGGVLQDLIVTEELQGSDSIWTSCDEEEEEEDEGDGLIGYLI